MALQAWVGRSAAQLDADSPLDITLHNSYDDDLIHLRQVLYGDGAGAFLTPIDGHNHLGTGANSAVIGDDSIGEPQLIAGQIDGAKMINSVVGEYRQGGMSEAESEVSTSYTVSHRVSIPRSGAYRFRFEIQHTTGQMYAKVYRNAAPVGVEKTVTSAAWTQQTDDISGWAAGDIAQLFIRVATAGTAEAREFEACSNQATAQVVGEDINL